MSALSNPNSLTPYDTLENPELPQLHTLVDSGSTHCFIDNHFLFDGTSTFTITQAVDVNIHFTSGNVTLVTLFLAPLDSECKIVLGHDWLTCYNLLIDWVLSSLTFWTPAQGMPTLLTPPVSPVPTSLPDPGPSDQPGLAPSVPASNSPAHTPLKAPLVSLINAAAFMCACRLEGSVQFQLQLHPLDSVQA
ncbi:hypothetical protein M404DRAFT_31200 [Pisolithus tinctorius Marx 270]|uniref:Peptidase A2 domain-containing protein n=1 Tax=Pisolithus tinctorius Marx 270 TaxID=870435 RepID=A0A0C3INH1_PISTI|nr:hypothetical protein M404DRAFT_31200 [Pisolithus tinctorius Marx 270]